MEQMKHGMKPMLFTFIPFILVFQWMAGAYGTIGHAYNVTVVETFPADAAIAKVDAGLNGRYLPEEKTIVWNWTHIPAATAGEVNVTLSFAENRTLDPSQALISVEYVLHNGTTGRFSSGDDPSSIIRAGHTNPKIEGNKVEYGIIYSSVGKTTVATVLGFEMGWFWWYFICSFISSIAFNKVFGNT